MGHLTVTFYMIPEPAKSYSDMLKPSSRYFVDILVKISYRLIEYFMFASDIWQMIDPRLKRWLYYSDTRKIYQVIFMNCEKFEL